MTRTEPSDPAELDGATVVMAHPDDEILWASAALGRSRRAILCYGDIPGQEALSQGRAQAMRTYPLEGVTHLAIPESGGFASAGWPLPEETPAGLRCRRNPQRYEANAERLQRELRERLEPGEVVVTHNPWGEYGHEEHVQVHRAVMALAEALRLRVWVSGYCSNHTFLLMQRHLGRLGPPTPALATDEVRTEQLKAHYRHHGCWTWAPEYAWPAHEVYFPVRGGERTKPANGASLPMNVIWRDSPLRLSMTLDPFR